MHFCLNPAFSILSSLSVFLFLSTKKPKKPKTTVPLSAPQIFCPQKKQRRNNKKTKSPLYQNTNFGSQSIAQWNLDISDRLNTFSIGTSLRLHHAIVIRGSR